MDDLVTGIPWPDVTTAVIGLTAIAIAIVTLAWISMAIARRRRRGESADPDDKGDAP